MTTLARLPISRALAFLFLALAAFVASASAQSATILRDSDALAETLDPSANDDADLGLHGRALLGRKNKGGNGMGKGYSKSKGMGKGYSKGYSKSKGMGKGYSKGYSKSKWG